MKKSSLIGWLIAISIVVVLGRWIFFGAIDAHLEKAMRSCRYSIAQAMTQHTASTLPYVAGLPRQDNWRRLTPAETEGLLVLLPPDSVDCDFTSDQYEVRFYIARGKFAVTACWLRGKDEDFLSPGFGTILFFNMVDGFSLKPPEMPPSN